MDDMDRRRFFKIGSLGVLSSLLAQDLLFSQGRVAPAGTAEACILIKLYGAPSHVDTFDLKVGPWTPRDFDIVNCGGIQISRRLFPNLCRLAGELSVVRSCRAWTFEHGQGLYAVMAGRQFNPGFVPEWPHIGSVVSLEFALRGEEKAFPAFLAFNSINEIEAAFIASRFGARHNPFITSPNAPNITHPLGEDRFQKRWQLLQRVDKALRQGQAPHGEVFDAFGGLYAQAMDLTHLKPFGDAFQLTNGEREKYGASQFGNACAIANKVLASNQGTHFIVITHSGEGGQTWDHHFNIYAEQNLRSMARELDNGLGALIDDLKQAPFDVGASWFDKTLIVVMGEFGRATGELNESGGRDHHDVHSALFAGGGIRGRRVIGVTDASGEEILESGLPGGRRHVRPEDIAATIYSALGINWTKEIRETPSGRPYAYTPSSREGRHAPISPLFD